MSYKVALNFEDGVTRFIEARPDELIADAAYRLGLNIPLDCRDGVCGTCKGHCESGDYSLGDYLEDAMTEDEAGQGYVLTCQMKAKSPCVIRIPASSASCKIKVESHVTELGEVRTLSPSSVGFSVRFAPASKVTFLPGQYMNLVVPGTTQTRSYSFSSMPAEGRVEFLVRNIPGGLMSTYLTQHAKAGDPLTMTGPVGSFYLREIRRPVLFLAGGTGLAPFLAMFDEMDSSGAPHAVHMIYGVTNDADLVEVEKIEAFAARTPTFTYATVVADEASGHARKGYVTHHLRDEALNDGDVDIYLCGPPPMVDAVRQHLAEKDVVPTNFYFEKFSPSESR